MKIINRRKLDRPIHVCSGDTIELGYTDKFGHRTVVLSSPITKAATYDEAVIFEDEFEGRPALGGLFVEKVA